MDPERWRRVGQLFAELHDLDPEAREERLVALGRVDAGMEAELRSLLANEDESFLSRPLLPRASPLDEELRPGDRVGPYRVLSELGRGGMGRVLRARDDRLEREVALKLLAPELDAEEARRDRLIEEARLLARSGHPNVVAVHGLEELETGGAVLVLELVEGEGLDERLEAGPPPLAEALRLAREIAEGLRAAHQSGVLHGDLKPSNVRLDREGRAKVLDFGLGRRLDLATGTRAERLVRGTPGYMSPEQLRGEELDARSDVFAFGCLVFELITARPAFPGEDLESVLRATLDGRPAKASWPEGSPAGLSGLLRRCLSADREARPAGFDRVLDELGRLGPVDSPRTLRPSDRERLIGREKELARLREMLAEARLVSLLGPGGVGKTRLAGAVASGLDEVTSVSLGGLSAPADPAELALAELGLHERGDREAGSLLADCLGESEGLLVLDNCEHLLAASSRLVALLLKRCPKLRILVTSREALGHPSERVLLLEPLSLPEQEASSEAELERSGAAALFLERARRARPALRIDSPDKVRAVARICLRTDGLPLALELAASRADRFSLPRLAARLSQDLRWLDEGDDRDERRTLRAVFEWSRELLSEEERSLLARLAAFDGAFTLEAVERCGPDGERLSGRRVVEVLTALTEKGLVLRQDGAGARLHRLLEPTRELAGEVLDRLGMREEVLDLLVDHALGLAGRAGPELAHRRTGAPSEARLDAEDASLRTALRRCRDRPEGRSEALRIATALWTAWLRRGRSAFAHRVLSEALDREGPELDPELELRALRATGTLAFLLGRQEEAASRLQSALALARQRGEAELTAVVLDSLALVAARAGRSDEARRLHEEALALAGAEAPVDSVLASLGNLAGVALGAGRYDEALAGFDEVLARARAAGARESECLALGNRAFTWNEMGRAELALRAAEEAGAIARSLGDPTEEARAEANAGRALQLLGSRSEARRRLEAAALRLGSLELPFLLAHALAWLLELRVDALEGGLEASLSEELEGLFARASSAARSSGARALEAAALALGARLAASAGKVRLARSRTERALAVLPPPDPTTGPAELRARLVLFELERDGGCLEAAEQQLVAARRALARRLRGARELEDRRSMRERLPASLALDRARG